MKIILLQNIKGLGQIGDVKNVADGHARNFLLPRNMAKPATDAALKTVDTLKKKRVVAIEEDRENAHKIAEVLKTVTLEISHKASPAGNLFAGVTKNDLAEKLKEVAGIILPPDSFKIEHEHIKKVGEYSVLVHLIDDLTIPITVIISASEK